MVEDLVELLRAEPSARRRAALIRERAAQWGCPESRVRRRLAAAGWRSGRRRRSDAGQTKVPDESLSMLAAALLAGQRQSGQAPLAIPVARHSLAASGVDFAGASDAHLARLLRERGLDLATQRGGAQSHVWMRSEHPNAVHEVDPSVALLYYAPAGGQRDLAAAPGGTPYKNKPGRREKVWRYVLVDHYSGCIYLDYYATAGESAAVMWDFLCGAWGPQEEPLAAFHGVPRLLVWDAGSANTSAPIRTALAALGVETHVHQPGSPRVKGAVESAQWVIERHFESRLRLQPVDSLDELRAAARRWAAAWNADAVPGIDCRRRRRTVAHVRLEAWQRITPDQLRELPAEARDLAVYEAARRKVAGDLTVTLRHPSTRRREVYRVGGLPGVRVGATVELQPLLMDAPGAVRVTWTYQGAEATEMLLPVEHDEVGQPLDAPTWGEYRRQPEPEVEREHRRLVELAGPVGPRQAPFGGRVRALDAVTGGGDPKVVPMPRRGRPVVVEGPAPAAVLGTVAAARWLQRRLGAAWDGSWMFGELRRRWPRGAAETELEAWAAELAGGAAAADAEAAG